MTNLPTAPSDGGDNGHSNRKTGRRPGARKPRRPNPHFMTAAEAIAELDGLISRNGFYAAFRRNEIPGIEIGRLIFVLRDFVPQLKERALRKLHESEDLEAESPRASKPRNNGDGDETR